MKAATGTPRYFGTAGATPRSSASLTRSGARARADIPFDDVRAAEKQLRELGATKPTQQPGGEHWPVLLDPSGQPSCISAGG
ncbi:VOC family protein [Streptomyces sp. G-G2]|uniref:VOC family protein n=1 Tax=Streptomyces sp. G-G2 TaxID=3046201 RepID=UPI0024BAB579|nr:VOC family protein [Streptomyces sp. G-G2]MDJ0385808.1 VOC family protein [Streptomyces sp. G-G2]